MKLSEIFKNYLYFFLFYFFGFIGILFVSNTILTRIANIQLYSFSEDDIKIIFLSFLISLICMPLIYLYKKKGKEKIKGE